MPYADTGDFETASLNFLSKESISEVRLVDLTWPAHLRLERVSFSRVELLIVRVGSLIGFLSCSIAKEYIAARLVRAAELLELLSLRIDLSRRNHRGLP